MIWEFWEYLNGRNEREFSRWRLGLPKVERARLDDKMRAIETMGVEVSCLRGPLKGYKHIYKIRVQGPTMALRPLLCKGPLDKDKEFTLLHPMTEVGMKDEPVTAKDEAERRRREIEISPSRRIRYEVPKP